MATLADYQVLHGGEFTLDATTNVTEQTLGFQVPTDFVHGTNKAKPILAFMAASFETSTFNVRVNHQQIISWRLSKSQTRSFWKPFSARIPFPEGGSHPDTVDVEFRVSTGKIEFENVVMWYQVRT